jgi:hypothetical protein
MGDAYSASSTARHSLALVDKAEAWKVPKAEMQSNSLRLIGQIK